MRYVSYLSNDIDYRGVLLNKYSLNKLGSNVPHMCLCMNMVSEDVKDILKSQGIQIINVDFLGILKNSGLSDAMVTHLYEKHFFGKFSMFLLEGEKLDRCIFLDSDFLIMENLDHLFDLEVTDVTMHMVPDTNLRFPDQIFFGENTFNSGLIVYRPNKKVFNDMLAVAREIESDPGSLDKLATDQEFFNYLAVTSKIRIRKLAYRYNVYPHIAASLLNNQIEESIAVIHFISRPKPWNMLDICLGRRSHENELAKTFYVKWLELYLEYVKREHLTYMSPKQLSEHSRCYSSSLSEDAVRNMRSLSHELDNEGLVDINPLGPENQ